MKKFLGARRISTVHIEVVEMDGQEAAINGLELSACGTLDNRATIYKVSHGSVVVGHITLVGGFGSIAKISTCAEETIFLFFPFFPIPISSRSTGSRMTKQTVADADVFISKAAEGLRILFGALMNSKPRTFPAKVAGITFRSEDFWRENMHGGWATAIVVLFLFACRLLRAAANRFRGVRRDAEDSKPVVSKNEESGIRILEIISDDDLRNLINNLENKLEQREKWEDVIEKKSNQLSYKARCCKPKDGPVKYSSVTIFENCTTELLKDFYMDNDYRKEWDKTVVDHTQLQIFEINGIEIGQTIKKFPLLTPREYVLAWRIWEGKDKTFYCIIKDCEHALALRQKKYVRVEFFRSSWRIRKVPGRDACEIAMVHQEDAGLNVEMAKLAFARGIWSYVCKMENALRKYPSPHRLSRYPAKDALQLIQKVPPELEASTEDSTVTKGLPGGPPTVMKSGESKLFRKPSKKFVANSLLLLGGLVCLSRGRSSLGAKFAMACLLKKLTKREATAKPQEAKSPAV